VVPDVQEHVGEGISHLAGRAQDPQVIAAVEHGASSAERAVHRVREPLRDRLHTAAERGRPLRLDDQVYVIALHRVVHEPEVTALARLPQARAQLAKKRPPAQRRHALAHSKRDEARMVPRERGPRDVVDTGPRSCRPACSAAWSAATAVHAEIRKAELT
jgi:hypothetical protein